MFVTPSPDNVIVVEDSTTHDDDDQTESHNVTI